MNSCKDILTSEIDKSLSPAGFIRKGKTWRKLHDDIYWILELQKSDYSDKYYINLGIYINAVAFIKDPQLSKCHISLRANDVFKGVDDHVIDTYLDCEHSIPEELRRQALRNALVTGILPFLQKFSSVSAVGKIIDEKSIPGLYPRISLINFLMERKTR